MRDRRRKCGFLRDEQRGMQKVLPLRLPKGPDESERGGCKGEASERKGECRASRSQHGIKPGFYLLPASRFLLLIPCEPSAPPEGILFLCVARSDS
jgi:hypothetical protein